MDIIYLLLPLSLILVGIIVAAILWAVKSRQFDDLEGPAYRILMDEPEDAAPHIQDTQPPRQDEL